MNDAVVGQLVGVPVVAGRVASILRSAGLHALTNDVVALLEDAAARAVGGSGTGVTAREQPATTPVAGEKASGIPRSPAAATQPVAAASPQPIEEGHLADYTDPERLRYVLDTFAPDNSGAEAESTTTIERRSGRGGVALRWSDPAGAGEYSVFRLVTSDTAPPWSPDAAEADVVAVTTQLAYVDRRPPITAVRHYQVWRNTGADHEAAVWGQPELIGEFSTVFAPTGFQVTERGNQVIGSWQALPGTERVHVYRIPKSQLRLFRSDPGRFRIATEPAARNGFIDDGAKPGETYLYQIVAEASIAAGQMQSATPQTAEFTGSATPQFIGDLTCQQPKNADEPVVNLEWTAQGRGSTRIYCTPARPTSGSDRSVLPVGELQRLGLPDDAALSHPVVQTDGRCSMERVGWPRGWGRMYLTPVHIVGHEARVGGTVLQVLPPTLTALALHQRVDFQTITLAWPVQEGVDATRVGTLAADRVSIFQAAPDVPVRAAIATSPLVTVSKEDYDRRGGIVLDHALRAQGSVVYAVPYAHAGTDVVEGKPASVTYPGLLRIQTTLKITRRSVFKAGWAARVAFTADRDSPSPTFCVVHRADRLPLAPEDGTHLPVVRAGIEGDVPSQRFQPSRLGSAPSDIFTVAIAEPGYVRVFALLGPDRRRTAALLDPPIDDMRCGK